MPKPTGFKSSSNAYCRLKAGGKRFTRPTKRLLSGLMKASRAVT